MREVLDSDVRLAEKTSDEIHGCCAATINHRLDHLRSQRPACSMGTQAPQLVIHHARKGDGRQQMVTGTPAHKPLGVCGRPWSAPARRCHHARNQAKWAQRALMWRVRRLAVQVVVDHAARAGVGGHGGHVLGVGASRPRSAPAHRRVVKATPGQPPRHQAGRPRCKSCGGGPVAITTSTSPAGAGGGSRTGR